MHCSHRPEGEALRIAAGWIVLGMTALMQASYLCSVW
jgi:hypothetical protein